MTMLLDLARAARSSGLRVVEVDGWQTRTRKSGKMRAGAPMGVMVHHTATSAKAAGNYPTLNVILNGHGGLSGPLANLGLGRDGTVYVTAAGAANHAGTVDSPRAQNNVCIGIEAEHPGVGPWTDTQYDAYVTLCAALVKWYRGDISNVRGHKEAAMPRGRKTDPNFDMGKFRAAVAVKIAAPALGPAGLISAAVNTAGRLTATPAPVSEDGYYGARTHDAFMWLVDGDRLAAFTRDNVRDVQTWAGRERTGIFTRGDILAIQAKVSARQDGDWIRSTSYVSNTTLGLQRVINKRIRETTR